MEIIRFKITIYLVIKQNILNLVAKVQFIKMSTPQKKAQCVSWFIETKLDIRLKFCCANFPSLQNRSNKNISKNKIFTNFKNCNDNTGQQKKSFCHSA